ncbi:MAG: hypothetical protein OEY61_09880 [Gammaproteobacteria bacterium]|nr:hypothetical protein [Gammaproteobacteria bacterium]
MRLSATQKKTGHIGNASTWTINDHKSRLIKVIAIKLMVKLFEHELDMTLIIPVALHNSQPVLH